MVQRRAIHDVSGSVLVFRVKEGELHHVDD